MEALKVFIDENLKEGKILPSKSLQASPFFFVLKKDGMFRPCQDYCYINSHMVKNTYPLPCISDLVDILKHSWYFTKLDIWWGYNNIWLKETNQWKAAFTTPYGLYEPTVMFFGQCNSPPTFQVFMNHIFTDYLMKGWLIIYMDDLMVHSVNLEEHISCVRLVLQRLCKHKLSIKLEKCIFCALQAEYLGLIVGEGQISMDPVKLVAINNWEPPRSVSAVYSFMGFCNFYWKFIPNFSNIVQPLLSLMKKNMAWQWLPNHASSFQTLKEAFLNRDLRGYTPGYQWSYPHPHP